MPDAEARMILNVKPKASEADVAEVRELPHPPTPPFTRLLTPLHASALWCHTGT